MKKESLDRANQINIRLMELRHAMEAALEDDIPRLFANIPGAPPKWESFNSDIRDLIVKEIASLEVEIETL